MEASRTSRTAPFSRERRFPLRREAKSDGSQPDIQLGLSRHFVVFFEIGTGGVKET